jgi:multidrug efflux system membrane fusion protein
VVTAGASAAALFSVNQITPIAATFTVPQGDFNRLAKASEGFSKALPVAALSQDTGETLAAGALSFVDNHVDANTGTVALKAVFPNADRRLLPGQFVNVKMTLAVRKGALVVPVNAVNQGPKGPYAYVVGKSGKAEVRPVVTDGVEGPLVLIASGLKVGESVVLDGQMTLRPGASVAVVKPGAQGKAAK